MDSPLTRYNDTDINATEKMRHDFAPTGMNRNFKFYQKRGFSPFRRN